MARCRYNEEDGEMDGCTVRSKGFFPTSPLPEYDNEKDLKLQSYIQSMFMWINFVYVTIIWIRLNRR